MDGRKTTTKDNDERPPSSLGYKTPSEFSQLSQGESYGKDAIYAHVENAHRVFHFATALAASFVLLIARKLGADQSREAFLRRPFSLVLMLAYQYT